MKLGFPVAVGLRVLLQERVLDCVPEKTLLYPSLHSEHFDVSFDNVQFRSFNSNWPIKDLHFLLLITLAINFVGCVIKAVLLLTNKLLITAALF